MIQSKKGIYCTAMLYPIGIKSVAKRHQCRFSVKAIRNLLLFGIRQSQSATKCRVGVAFQLQSMPSFRIELLFYAKNRSNSNPQLKSHRQSTTIGNFIYKSKTAKILTIAFLAILS